MTSLCPKNKAHLEGAPFIAHRRTKSWCCLRQSCSIILTKFLACWPHAQKARIGLLLHLGILAGTNSTSHHNSTQRRSRIDPNNRFTSIELQAVISSLPSVSSLVEAYISRSTTIIGPYLLISVPSVQSRHIKFTHILVNRQA